MEKMNREEVYKLLKIKKSEQKVVDKVFDWIRDNCDIGEAVDIITDY